MMYMLFIQTIVRSSIFLDVPEVLAFITEIPNILAPEDGIISEKFYINAPLGLVLERPHVTHVAEYQRLSSIHCNTNGQCTLQR